MTGPPIAVGTASGPSLLEILAGYAFPGAANAPSGAILLLFPLALLIAALVPRLPRLHLGVLVAASGGGAAGYRAIALRPG